MMKTWLENESITAKHGVVPITRDSSLGVQNPKIQNFIHIFVGSSRQRLPL
jgi:hypothetical protein